MKKSVFVSTTFQNQHEKTEAFDIPKCESISQFFTLKNSKRKKRNNPLAFSMTIQHGVQNSLSIKSLPIQPTSIQKFHVNDALTSVTDSSSTAEKAISFKKTSLRQKMNRMEALSLQHHKPLEYGLKKQVHCPRSPVINLHKTSLSQFVGKPKIHKNWSISDFHVLRKIGQGSYSQVYLAMEKLTGFICSLKIIRKNTIKQQKLLHVVIRQLKIHHYLNHKNVVQLYGQFDDEQNIYLICQYCTDGDLHKYLKSKQRQNQQIQVQEVSRVVGQICQAIALMHKNYLMHRDIKPENVFLTMGNVVKLGDFGWSVYYGDQGLRNTQCGTPLYLAPELIQQNQYSQTIDIWAIGVLAYELLTGQIPFKIRTAQDLSKIISQDIKFHYIENQLARDFVKKLLQKDAKLRMEIEDVLQHPFLSLQKND